MPHDDDEFARVDDDAGDDAFLIDVDSDGGGDSSPLVGGGSGRSTRLVGGGGWTTSFTNLLGDAATIGSQRNSRRSRTPSFSKMDSVSIFEHLQEDVDTEDTIVHLTPSGRRRIQFLKFSWWKKVALYLVGQTVQTWLFLCILGALAAFVAYLTDLAIVSLYRLQLFCSNQTDIFILNYAIWVGYSAFFCALSCTAVELISWDCQGSGIPEMRNVLSGVVMKGFLSVPTFIGKILGLVSAFGGGLSIGKEGPYVHLSSIIARQMYRIPLFTKIHRNPAVQQQLLAAACAVGVATSFGAPIGGVIFSVEVLATYYFVENLWKAFFAAVFGAVVMQACSFVGSVGMTTLFTADHFASHTYALIDLAGFGLMGLGAGVLGGVFVKALVFSINGSFTCGLQTRRGHYARVVLGGMMISLVTFPLLDLRNDQQHVITYLLQEQAIGDWAYIVFLLVGKSLIAIYSIGFTGIPCGLYTPMFILGLIYGRLCGEIAAAVPWFYGTVSPAVYSIIGGAAFSAGTTRTISTSVIIVELTSQIELALPILVAVLIAYAISQFFSEGAYDVILRQKGIPTFLYKPENTYNQMAGDVMKNPKAMLNLNSTYQDAETHLQGNTTMDVFPLVEDDESMIFLGVVSRADLTRHLQSKGYVMRDRHEGRATFSSIIEGGGRRVSHLFNATRSRGGAHHSNGPSGDKRRGALPVWTRSDDSAHSMMEMLPDEVALAQGDVAALGDSDDSDGPETSSGGGGGPANSPLPYVFKSRGSPSPKVEDVVMVDPSAFQMAAQLPLYKVHFVFTMLGLHTAYITSRGKLVGILSRPDLLSNRKVSRGRSDQGDPQSGPE